jgi:rare lipoprotein A
VHRFRWKRKRIAALALLPVTVLTAASSISYVTAATIAPASGVELKLGKRHVRTGEPVKLSGAVAPGGQHPVVIEVDGRKVATTTSGPMGEFHAKWRAGGPGVYKITATVTDGAAPIGSKSKRLNAYRAVQASYYGPGLYGGHLACGGTLTPSTQGVANKTLPCGTEVTLRHSGHTVTVPVVDRGPYSGNREYDLTAATKRKLGFGSTGTVLSTK